MSPDTRIIRMHGPPGTGKTTRLARRTHSTVAERGPDAIKIASFSVTAATEIAGREGVAGVLPERAVGTLHSHAYRAIGQPDVALDPKIITRWNGRVGIGWRITGDTRHSAMADRTAGPGGLEDPEGGDQLLAALDMLRARQTPGPQWPLQVRAFAKEWTAWKREDDLVDFCMDERTEVFTVRGWVGGEQIREGDLVRSINPDTGLAEWQPVESVHRRYGHSPMIHMSNAVHDSVTTPDHRWLVNRRDSQENWSRVWATTVKLNSTCRIPRAAISGDAPTDAKYGDAFVELVAWWFTEGSYRSNGCRGGQIGQSHRVNPAYCARIEAALRALSGKPGLLRDGQVVWSISRSEVRGMTFYGLGGDLVDELDGVAPDKVPTIEFLAQLTTAQLRMFVDTALDADGHVRAQASVFGQRDRCRTEAFAAAASLAGMAVTFAKPRLIKGGEFYEVTVSSRRLHAVVPGTTGGHSKGTRVLRDYNGLIWCPTVARHHNFLARRNGKTYFTGNSDMIIRAYELAAAGMPLDGEPSVLVVDEAQDMTPIESALALAWGDLLGPDGRLVFALDDDQAIMDFRGGDPAVILAADATDEILTQSYRVPPAVHAAAQTWITRCSERFRKDYHPRTPNPDRDPTSAHSHGWAYRVGYTLADPELVDALERDTADGATVMVIASCGYMLTPLIRQLRTCGIPFHNPYRPGEPAWNPLGRPTRGMSTATRVLRYLICDEQALGDQSRLWTAEDIAAWTHLVGFKAACLARGAERAIEALAEGTVAFEHVAALFRDDDDGVAALRAATGPDLEWFASVITPSKAKVTAYPLQVARAQGAGALMGEPRIVLGTIHSVKGGQADHVYLAPDMSAAGMRQWRGESDARDQTIRLFYVGMTRAFHGLTVLAPITPTAVPPAELIPSGLEVRR